MDRKRIIDILNHRGGYYTIQVWNKSEFCKIGIWETSLIYKDIQQVCYNKNWYEDYEGGIIYYKILADIIVK